MDNNVDLSFLEGCMLRRVNGDLEFGKDILGDLDSLLECLIADVCHDFPVSQDG